MVDSDLLHEHDNTSLEHRVLDPHEGLGERESVGRGENVEKSNGKVRCESVYPGLPAV